MNNWLFSGARRSLSSVLLGAACCVVTSCKLEPCGNVKLGDRLVITLGEQFDPDPYTAGWEPETCQEAFGIYAGMELHVTIDGFRMGNTCESAEGLIEGLDEVSLSREGAREVAGNALFREGYLYSIPGSTCIGNSQIEIDVNANPTPPRSGTRRLPGVMTFVFWPTGEVDDCPSSCGVRFIAQVRVE